MSDIGASQKARADRPNAIGGGIGIELLRSRLCRTITLTVFLSILAIEAAVLVPSYLRYEADLLDRVEEVGLTAATAAYGPRAHASDRDLLIAGQLLNRSRHFRGGTLYRPDGTPIGGFGTPPELAPAVDGGVARQRTRDGASLDVVWPPSLTGLPFIVTARLNTEWIGAELAAFVWRILGLVLILSLGVATVTVLIVGRQVLRPILRLRHRLLAVRADPADAQRHALTYPKADEIGDIVDCFNDLLSQVSAVHVDELRAREQRFRDFADAASDFFWEMDENLRFSYFSARMSAIAGMSETEMLGKTRAETGIPDIAPELWQRHLDDLQAHRPFRGFVHPRTRPDGRRVFLSINGKPVFDADGTFRGYRGTGADITDRVEVEEALQESQQRFRDFAAASSDWFWEMDRDLRFTYVSSGVEDVSGMAPEWHYGKTRQEIGVPNVAPRIWAEHLATLNARAPFKDFVYCRRDPAGDKWMRTSGVPVFDATGEFKGYRGTGSDITDHVEAEEEARLAQQRLAAAVEGLSDMFALWGPDDRLVVCNQRYRDTNATGTDATSEPGIGYEAHIRAVLAAQHIPAATNREEVWVRERLQRHRHPDGPFEMQRKSGRWLLVREERMPDGSTVTIGTDITQRKHMEQALRRAMREAERANSAKSEFLAGMSHELRTPLNAIIGFSEMIRDEIAGPVGAPAYKDYATDIHASGQHLLGIISDLLDLAKIEAGKLDLNESDVDLTALTRDCLRLIGPRAEAAKLTVNADATAAPAPVWADERLVRQIVLNLLSNAIKFTPEGGRIDIGITRDDDGIAVSVRDNGIGIDPAQIDRLLSPFEQAESRADVASEGTGLGLSVSKALAELHGGSLILESTVDEGTTAVVTLPPSRVRDYARAS